MSNALKIAAYFLGTLILGALLAPPLFWAGQGLGHAWGPLHKLAEFEFRRYFDRAMFLAALLLLWPTVRALRVGGWRDLGLARDPRRWTHLSTGFVTAGGSLWLMGLGLWWLGLYAPRPAGAIPWGSLPGFLVAAAAVACAEEGFFRGALQGLIGRTASGAVAWVFVGALFAVLHFLRPPEDAARLHRRGTLAVRLRLPAPGVLAMGRSAAGALAAWRRSWPWGWCSATPVGARELCGCQLDCTRAGCSR